MPPFGTLHVQQPWIPLGLVLPAGTRTTRPLSLVGIPAGFFATFQYAWFDGCSGAVSATNALEMTVQ